MGEAYVGIDQSYSGLAIVALHEPDVDHQEFLCGFEPKKHGSGIQRLLAIEDHIYQTLDQIGPVSHVCMEGYANGAKFGREKAGELGATVKRALFEQYGPSDAGFPTIVAPTALKKFVTGRGNNVKKNEMLLAVYKRWGYETTNDNLADAYALARVAQACHELMNGSEDYPAFQQEVVQKLTLHTERHA